MKRFVAYAETADQLLDVSIRAISVSRGMPRVFKAVATAIRNDADWNEEDHKSTLERIESDAAFANKECDTGFPLLHEFTLVGVWGAFEAAVEDMIVGILSNEPEILRTDPFAKIRIPLADFETLDKEDRMRILLRELQRTFRSDQRQGVTGFEAVLGAVGLSGDIKDDVREGIWEMHHARNIIVHRRSCADRSFVAACPKLGLKIGDRIPVTHDLLRRYVECLVGYGIDIIYRIGTRYGVDMGRKPEFLPK
jgi:hypothetical protein